MKITSEKLENGYHKIYYLFPFQKSGNFSLIYNEKGIIEDYKEECAFSSNDEIKKLYLHYKEGFLYHPTKAANITSHINNDMTSYRFYQKMPLVKNKALNIIDFEKFINKEDANLSFYNLLSFLTNNTLYRENDLPTKVSYKGSILENEVWHKNGMKHRDNGPALIIYYNNLVVQRKEYYKKDFLHRDDGPASISYSEKGEEISREYYLEGELVKT